MKRVKGESQFDEKGEQGIAVVTKISATQARVDFEETKKTFNINVVQVEEENTIPMSFPFKPMKVNAKITIKATMNKDGTKILFASPFSGDFKVVLDKILAPKGSPDGTPPAPETFTGKKHPYEAFGVMFEIVEGRWAGTKVWARLYPNFGDDGEGNLAIAGQGSGSDMLFDFMEALGLADEVIPFSENPLPEIQTLALEKKNPFKIVIQKGWVDMIVKDVDEEDAFVDEPTTGENPTQLELPLGDEDNVDTIHPALQ